MINLEQKAAGLLAVCALSAGMAATAYGATSTFEMRKNVVSLLGIITTSNTQATVTRAEFARMLMNASDDRQLGRTVSNVSVFADVPSTSEYATAIRTASANEWMSGYLGGNFKPDEPVTMRDAVKAALALLGYRRPDWPSLKSCPWIPIFTGGWTRS